MNIKQVFFVWTEKEIFNDQIFENRSFQYFCSGEETLWSKVESHLGDLTKLKLWCFWKIEIALKKENLRNPIN